jgi:hypothetical protein
MVRLPPTNNIAPAIGAFREILRPVHPVNAGVDVILVQCPGLEDKRNLAVVRAIDATLVRLLPLDALLVRHEDKVALAKLILAHYHALAHLLTKTPLSQHTTADD